MTVVPAAGSVHTHPVLPDVQRLQPLYTHVVWCIHVYESTYTGPRGEGTHCANFRSWQPTKTGAVYRNIPDVKFDIFNIYRTLSYISREILITTENSRCLPQTSTIHNKKIFENIDRKIYLPSIVNTTHGIATDSGYCQHCKKKKALIHRSLSLWSIIKYNIVSTYNICITEGLFPYYFCSISSS